MTHMIIDALPNYCPECGRDLRENWKGIGAISDWYANASRICCGCGTHYQYAETDRVIKAAQQAGGDMK